MPDTPSVVLVKEFTYRQKREEFSNRYHFSGATPADAAAWAVLMDQLIELERPTVTADVKFVRGYGYQAGIEHSVAQVDFSVPGPAKVGTLTGPLSSALLPGDCAATIRWYTGELNSRGKKVYCRKYMHGVYRSTGQPDNLDTAQAAAMATFAGKLISGTDWSSHKYCGPQGAVLSAPYVDPLITTRTLKRRGKRPLP